MQEKALLVVVHTWRLVSSVYIRTPCGSRMSVSLWTAVADTTGHYRASDPPPCTQHIPAQSVHLTPAGNYFAE